MELLKQLCALHAPSSEEFRVRDFIVEYVQNHAHEWKQKPEMYFGKGYQDTLLIKLGTPTHAFMAHMDSVGFMAGYENELVPIGSPAPNEGSIIRNEHDQERNVYYDNHNKAWMLNTDDPMELGSTWTWKPSFKENDDCIESPFLDNRLSIYVLLKIASQLTNVVLAFSTYEETQHGGKAAMLVHRMFQKWQVDKIIVADITWVTSFVASGDGVVVSYRDVGIPRRKFREKIEAILTQAKVKYQVEIEKSGGSDGTAIASSIYPIDWLFVGAPEVNPHGSIEKVHKKDVASMVDAYLELNKHI